MMGLNYFRINRKMKPFMIAYARKSKGKSEDEKETKRMKLIMCKYKL